MCGDVDVLLSHPDDALRRGLFAHLLARLKAIGLLTHDLSVGDEEGPTQQYVKKAI